MIHFLSLLLRRGSPALALLALLTSAPAFAAPGAHGPNGEHLEAPAQANSATSAAPRFEAQSEVFELVGRLQGGELSILINRFATNDPVLKAQVEIQAGQLKAQAPFHADLGDYAVNDEAMLKALQEPGEHALVITVLAGEDSDLLDATLRVTATAAAHDHDGWTHGVPRAAWIVGALVLLAAAAWLIGRRTSRRGEPQIAGGAQ